MNEESTNQHTKTHCHCGQERDSSDHCSYCYCEEYEGYCDKVKL